MALMNMREYAALQLRIPESGNEELDSLIRAANRRDGRDTVARPSQTLLQASATKVANSPHPHVLWEHANETWKEFSRNGRLVEAIKAYRSLYDVGLKEAKDAVEFEQKRKAF